MKMKKTQKSLTIWACSGRTIFSCVKNPYFCYYAMHNKSKPECIAKEDIKGNIRKRKKKSYYRSHSTHRQTDAERSYHPFPVQVVFFSPYVDIGFQQGIYKKNTENGYCRCFCNTPKTNQEAHY